MKSIRETVTISIQISTDNAAFEEDRDQEVARILRSIVDRIERGEHSYMKLMDINGNTVGYADLEWEQR